jgi:predicted tellurium resistance membrane protein TerC
MVIGQLLIVVRRYPALVDGAFVIIAWVGIKLMVEYLHQAGFIQFGINKWVSFGLIILIFGIAFLYARRQGPADQEEDDAATALLTKE